MEWEIFWNGAVRATAKCKFLFLGRRERKRLGFNVWSVGEQPLRIRDPWARDKHGPLKVARVAASNTSAQFEITLRTPLRYGESIEYSFGYGCIEYYKDVQVTCKDDFTVSLPTRMWEYEFVFPKGSALQDFRLTRRTGNMTLREFYDGGVRKGHPVAHFSSYAPRVGSRLQLEFSIRKA